VEPCRHVVLVDYGTLDPKQRNLLRLVFLDPHIRVKQPDWQGVARFVVGAFRGRRAGRGGEERGIVGRRAQPGEPRIRGAVARP